MRECVQPLLCLMLVTCVQSKKRRFGREPKVHLQAKSSGKGYHKHSLYIPCRILNKLSLYLKVRAFHIKICFCYKIRILASRGPHSKREWSEPIQFGVPRVFSPRLHSSYTSPVLTLHALEFAPWPWLILALYYVIVEEDMNLDDWNRREKEQNSKYYRDIEWLSQDWKKQHIYFYFWWR